MTTSGESPAIMVKLSRAPLELSFEAGSPEEALAVLVEKGPIFNEIFALPPLTGADIDAVAAVLPAPAAQGTAEPARRGRKPKNQPDPATASAPAPAPVPTAPAPASVPNDGLNIPAFLDRNKPAAPPPPPMPAAPSVVPSPLPPCVLGPKVVTELKSRAAGGPDGGKSLVDWLVSCNVVVPGATFDEACQVVNLIPDEKIKPVATALGIQ